jgi:hypothetical protein
MSLMDTLVRPTVLYGFEVWGDGLLESDLSSINRVKIILLRCIIKCKQTIPQPVVLVEYGARPFRLETIFSLISLLPYIQSFADVMKGWDWYPYLTYCSSESIASTSFVRSRCWYVGVLDLLASIGIMMDRLPPF